MSSGISDLKLGRLYRPLKSIFDNMTVIIRNLYQFVAAIVAPVAGIATGGHPASSALTKGVDHPVNFLSGFGIF